jgi:hypothetical protein
MSIVDETAKAAAAAIAFFNRLPFWIGQALESRFSTLPRGA